MRYIKVRTKRPRSGEAMHPTHATQQARAELDSVDTIGQLMSTKGHAEGARIAAFTRWAAGS